MLATLRQFLREGTPWRSLKATAGKVSGSTLRRHLEHWAGIGLLAQVHAGMLRGDPTLDSCSVRAKRGGDLTDPTDRGKRGTKYHIATTGDGVPVACVATGVLHQVHARLIRMVRARHLQAWRRRAGQLQGSRQAGR